MTPAARYAAAIDILDTVLAGKPTEAALIGWARGNRFAGSKDRAAIRDIVFQAQRRRASCAALGGAMTGRGIVRGLLVHDGIAVEDVFGAGQYAPAAWNDTDPKGVELEALSAAEAADVQPWVLDCLSGQYGAGMAVEICARLQDRAPLWVRANLARGTADAAFETLAEQGFAPVRSEMCTTAIQITENPRRLSQSAGFADGWFEPQDISSQMAVAALGDIRSARVLDFCAGGGGKSLALAALGADVTAHDANPKRMTDIAPRAQRAGVTISTKRALKDRFDIVVCDLPCSGSGAWRRVVDTKWTLTSDDLASLQHVQRGILKEAAGYLKPGGRLAVMTCSLLDAENAQNALWVQQQLGLHHVSSHQLTPVTAGDGFYWSIHAARV